MGKKLKILKNHADMTASPGISPPFRHGYEIVLAPAKFTALADIGKYQPAEQIEQRGLAGSGVSVNTCQGTSGKKKFRDVEYTTRTLSILNAVADIPQMKIVFHGFSQLVEGGIAQAELTHKTGMLIRPRPDFQIALHLNDGVVLHETLLF